MRFFTTEGPVNPADHYYLPPLARIDMAEIRGLIAQKKYFLLHAPRQTGKTSCLLALADLLNREGTYQCVYANIETAQAAREQVELGIADVVWKIALGIQQQQPSAQALTLAQTIRATTPATAQLQTFLNDYCSQLDKPLVLLLDVFLFRPTTDQSRLLPSCFGAMWWLHRSSSEFACVGAWRPKRSFAWSIPMSVPFSGTLAGYPRTERQTLLCQGQFEGIGTATAILLRNGQREIARFVQVVEGFKRK